MGIIEKIKEFFKKLKEENKGFGAAIKRLNSSDFCGAVNRGIKNADFWEGSYLNLVETTGLIYGSNQPDYTFSKEDIASFEPSDAKVTVAKGGNQLPAKRFIVTFNDGKRAQIDIVNTRIDAFKITMGL